MQSLNKIERKLLESDASTHLQLHTFGGMYNSHTCDIQTTYLNKKFSNVIVWSLFVLILLSCQQAHKIGPVKRHSDHRTSETSFGSEWRDSGPILGAGSANVTVPVIKHFFSHVETWLNWF